MQGMAHLLMLTCLSICRNLFEYDQVVNTQRDKVYAERRRALLTSDLTPLIIEYAEKTADDILEVWRLRMLMIFYSAFLLFVCGVRVRDLQDLGGAGGGL